jgi:hypothetical protein
VGIREVTKASYQLRRGSFTTEFKNVTKISITPKVRKIPPQDPDPTQSWWVLNPASGEFSPVLSEITCEYQLG